MNEIDLNLSFVNASDLYLTSEEIQSLCDEIKNNGTCTELNLCGNELGIESAKALGDLLQGNETLKKLHLQWNCFGVPNAMQNLISGLEHNNCLEFLDLRNNKIDQHAADCLSKIIQRSTALKELDLRWNNLGEYGGLAICSSLQKNQHLLVCHLSGNHIPLETLRRVEKRLYENQVNLDYVMKFGQTLEHQIQEKKALQDKFYMKEETLKTEVSSFKEEKESWQSKFIKLEHKYNLLNLEKKDSEQKGENLRNEIESYESECRHLEKLLAEEQQRVSEVEKNWENRIEKKTLEMTSLQTQFEQTAKISRESEEILKNLEIEKTSLLSTNQTLAVRVKELDRERGMNKTAQETCMNDLRKHLNEEIELEKKQTEQIKSEMISLVATLKKEKVTLNEKLNAARSEMISTKINYEEKMTNFESEIRQKKNDHVSNTLSGLEDAVARVGSERDMFIAETREKESQLQHMLEQAVTDRSRFETWITEEKELTRKARQQIRDLQLQVAQLQGSLQQRDQQLKSQHLTLQENQKLADTIREEHKLTLERILVESSRHCELLEKQCREKDSHISNLSNENHNLNIELQVLRKEQQRRRLVLAAALSDIQNVLPMEETQQHSQDIKMKVKNFQQRTKKRIIKKPKSASRNQRKRIRKVKVIKRKTSRTHAELLPTKVVEKQPIEKKQSTSNKKQKPSKFSEAIIEKPPAPAKQLAHSTSSLSDYQSYSEVNIDNVVNAQDFSSPSTISSCLSIDAAS